MSENTTDTQPRPVRESLAPVEIVMGTVLLLMLGALVVMVIAAM